jgi:hypothetical protein
MKKNCVEQRCHQKEFYITMINGQGMEDTIRSVTITSSFKVGYINRMQI